MDHRFLIAYSWPVLAGALMRGLWLQNHFHALVSDELAYHDLAVRLATGQPYGSPFWPPGWPGLLAIIYTIVGPDPQAGLWLNLVLSVLTIVLTGAIAHHLFGRMTAIGSMWLISLMPSYILPVVLLRYEIWLQFLLALGLWASLWMQSSGRWVWMTAGVTVLATLMRPLWVVLPVLLWLCRRRLQPEPVRRRHLIIAQSLVLLMLVPWVWVASAHSGRFVPVALNGGINLWIGNNPAATGAYMSPRGDYWEPDNEAVARAAAMQFIVENPGKTVGLLPAKLWYSFSHEPWVEWVFLRTRSDIAPHWQEFLLIGSELAYWPTLQLALGAIAWLIAAGRTRWLLPLLLLAFSVASQLPFFGTPRFRWSVQFLLVIYAVAFPFLLRAAARMMHPRMDRTVQVPQMALTLHMAAGREHSQ